jgi:hypothetical protein
LVAASNVGFAFGDVIATNHAESVGEGGRCTRFPYVIGTRLAHDIAGVFLGRSVVLVYRWMPIQGFVFFDVSGVFAHGSGSELGMELKFVAAIDSPGVDSRLRTVPCLAPADRIECNTIQSSSNER